MARRPRRNHTASFKTKMALAAIRGEYTLGELAQQNDVHANQIKQWRDQTMARSNNGEIKQWRDQLLEGAVGVFDRPGKSMKADPPIDVKTLHTKIGELTLENDFLEGALTKAGFVSAKK